MKTVPPLSLSAAKQRYPSLFQQFTHLSNRENDTMDDFGDDLANLLNINQASKIDPATGLLTFIMGTNFMEPLGGDDRGCPMKPESDANKFTMFLWKMLSASESGSVGGDACRQFDVLNGALDDTLEMKTKVSKFDHLLGWTAAAANHQLHALLDRGDPDRNRSLFKAVADEWKKIFEANDNESFVSEDLRSFANWQCGYFQQLLKQAKKEFGEHARYTFNFVKKPRPKKAAPAIVPSSATVTPDTVPMTAARLSSTSTIVITKETKDIKLGIVIVLDGGRLKVGSILPGSVSTRSDLQVGMIIESINGHQVTTSAEAVVLIKAIEGNVTFVVSTGNPSSSVADPSSNNLAANQNEDAAVTMPWEEEDYVPVTKAGKQKSPNVIRSELQKYIDQCKADGSRTQTNIIDEMGVNNNTFRRYMNPKTYKDQWSALQNGTYCAAARLLAKAKFESDMATKSGSAKRKAAARDGNTAKKAKCGNENTASSNALAKEDAKLLIDRIQAVEGISGIEVYDTCPQLVAKIKKFLARGGMTKANLLRAFGNINSNSLGRFLSGKGQDQCASVTYKAAYVFFEKLRIMEGKPKTKARLKNESEQIGGFSLIKRRAGGWVYCVPGEQLFF